MDMSMPINDFIAHFVRRINKRPIKFDGESEDESDGESEDEEVDTGTTPSPATKRTRMEEDVDVDAGEELIQKAEEDTETSSLDQNQKTALEDRMELLQKQNEELLAKFEKSENSRNQLEQEVQDLRDQLETERSKVAELERKPINFDQILEVEKNVSECLDIELRNQNKEISDLKNTVKAMEKEKQVLLFAFKNSDCWLFNDYE